VRPTMGWLLPLVALANRARCHAPQVDIDVTNWQRVTLFLPTNDAWDAFFQEIGVAEDEFLNNTEAFADIMAYHVYEGAFYLAHLRPELSLTMANDADIEFEYLDYDFVIRDAAGRTTTFWRDEDSSSPTAHTPGKRPPQVIAINRVLVPMRADSVEEALLMNSHLSMFYNLLEEGGYHELLKGENNSVTVLVPSNDAMEAGLEAWGVSYDDLIKDSKKLADVVSAHVLPMIYTWSDLKDMVYQNYHASCNLCMRFYPVEESNGALTIMGVGTTRESNGTITGGNIYAGDNALIHIIDGMLLPRYKFGTDQQCRITCQVLCEPQPDDATEEDASEDDALEDDDDELDDDELDDDELEDVAADSPSPAQAAPTSNDESRKAQPGASDKSRL